MPTGSESGTREIMSHQRPRKSVNRTINYFDTRIVIASPLLLRVNAPIVDARLLYGSKCLHIIHLPPTKCSKKLPAISRRQLCNYLSMRTLIPRNLRLDGLWVLIELRPVNHRNPLPQTAWDRRRGRKPSRSGAQPDG